MHTSKKTQPNNDNSIVGIKQAKNKIIAVHFSDNQRENEKEILSLYRWKCEPEFVVSFHSIV